VSENVRMYNWVNPPAPQDLWLAQFIKARNLLPKNKKMAIFSVFGLRIMMKFNRSDYKIFVPRENLHRSNWQHYDDLLLNEKWVDLVVGFDYTERENYIRFPLWLMWIFKPTDTYRDIKQICDRINNPHNSSYTDRKFCAFLSSHDDIGRQEIFDELSTVGRIDCDGRLFHNNDDLKTKFGDDKLAYLRNYRFNLCPENSDAEGYCTEKLFEAIFSGCTPIYWGSGFCPEPDVLNQNAILFVKIGKNEKNEDAIKQINQLNISEKDYLDFARQSRFSDNAPDIIWNYFEKLEEKLRKNLCQNRN
jgi:hypothetical protein